MVGPVKGLTKKRLSRDQISCLWTHSSSSVFSRSEQEQKQSDRLSGQQCCVTDFKSLLCLNVVWVLFPPEKLSIQMTIILHPDRTVKSAPIVLLRAYLQWLLTTFHIYGLCVNGAKLIICNINLIYLLKFNEKYFTCVSMLRVIQFTF